MRCYVFLFVFLNTPKRYLKKSRVFFCQDILQQILIQGLPFSFSFSPPCILLFLPLSSSCSSSSGPFAQWSWARSRIVKNPGGLGGLEWRGVHGWNATPLLLFFQGKKERERKAGERGRDGNPFTSPSLPGRVRSSFFAYFCQLTERSEGEI